MPHEEYDFDHEHQHNTEVSGGKPKMHLSKPLKIAIGAIGTVVGLVGLGLVAFVISLVAGPASGIAQFIASVWQGLLDALQPLADLYNNTINMIPGIGGAED